jgi:deoxyadenosine/deoxycytidine kinase
MSADGASAGPSNLIFVAGNIASGKSTTSRLLQQALAGKVVAEDVAGNPYLRTFYTDMARWSFHVDVHFLAARARDVLHQYQPGGTPTIFDRCYLEGAIFASISYASGLVSDEERTTFNLLLDTVHEALPRAGALVYLSAEPETLLRRVKRRGRLYEQNMPLQYLVALQNEYDAWFDRYDESPKVRLDTQDVDLRQDNEALRALAAQVAALIS